MAGSILRIFRKRSAGDIHYYKIIEKIFGFVPRNIELYKLALIHRSASVILDDGTVMNNERLEFLGDSILESIVSDYLFMEFPETNEGELTQMRSKIVSRITLNQLCVDIGLSEHVVSHAGGGVTQKHVYGDALEAMIGAIYLDTGYDRTKDVIILNVLSRYLNLGDVIARETDFKSRLIEWCQKSKHTIHFETGFSEGSTAQKPLFRSLAIIDDMEVGYGIGTSKKEAEQHAAFSVSQFMSDDLGTDLLDILDIAAHKHYSHPNTSQENESRTDTTG